MAWTLVHGALSPWGQILANRQGYALGEHPKNLRQVCTELVLRKERRGSGRRLAAAQCLGPLLAPNSGGLEGTGLPTQWACAAAGPVWVPQYRRPLFFPQAD